MMRDILIKDLGWKLFSLLLAAGIWLTVHRIIEGPKNAAVASASNPVTYGNLPVYVVATAADVHLYRVTPATVSVTVSGSPEAIGDLKANQLRATVDLTDLAAAKDLKQQVEVSAPSGITLIRVDPPQVGVILPARIK
jgi:YbbR domain-containing protein